MMTAMIKQNIDIFTNAHANPNKRNTPDTQKAMPANRKNIVTAWAAVIHSP